MSGIHRLEGRVQHYDWGGSSFLPELLGRSEDARPWAEYWLGAHPKASSLIDDTPWDRLISAQPQRWLQDADGEDRELPFLFKILDIAAPLSIQVHPNAEQARKGYDDENARGIAVDAPQRNFRDRNPKPELAVALGEFWLLYGFRKPAETASQLRRFAALQQLAELVEDDGTRALFAMVMSADGEQLEQWLLPVLEQIRERDASLDDPVYWIQQWLGDAPPQQRVDRGVLALMMMNLMRCQAGDAVFQAANVPHAYLRGQIVEVMGNSDNVLRGGLTGKHVDPEALLEHIDFSAGAPELITGKVGDAVEIIDYACPAEEFLLSRVLPHDHPLTTRSRSAEIWMCLGGRCDVSAGDKRLALDSGQALAVEAGTECRWHGQPAAELYRLRSGVETEPQISPSKMHGSPDQGEDGA